MHSRTHGSWLLQQAWIDTPFTDFLLIILPAFLVTGCVLVFPQAFSHANQLPSWLWVALIVGVDVTHVYSTLFRTYMNPTERQKHRSLLTFAPMICWAIGAMLYSVNALLFWRTLAYIAVFHFIRQQYGFMIIYARKESPIFKQWRWLDSTLIYLSMLYPLIYWHTHLPRHFNWFMEGDFVPGLPIGSEFVVGLVFLLTAIAYAIKEIRYSMQTRQVNLLKNLLILGTALSWNVGIVWFNGDLAFTATNVISHGIPYMALVWLVGKRESVQNSKPIKYPSWFTWKMMPVFILFLWGLAWLEEGLWDGFIWREHLNFFIGFSKLPIIMDQSTLAWLIPLLALPQSTHYILDGFIWRMKEQNTPSWSQNLHHGLSPQR